MTKKNLLSLMLASALMLTLAACGEKSPSSSESGSRSETESTSVSGPSGRVPRGFLWTSS